MTAQIVLADAQQAGAHRQQHHPACSRHYRISPKRDRQRRNMQRFEQVLDRRASGSPDDRCEDGQHVAGA